MSTAYADVPPLEESEIRDVLSTLAEHARAIVSASYVAIEVGDSNERPLARRISGTAPTRAAQVVTIPIVLDGEEVARCIVARSRRLTAAEQNALAELVSRFAPVAGRIREAGGMGVRAKHLQPDMDRIRREWTAIVAHDLRQPTGAISVFSRILASRIGECSELKHIEVACRRLERQIEDLLDASAIETHQMKLELGDVDLHALVHAVVERLSASVQGLELHVHVTGPSPTVRVDALRIEQVIENLVLNARKYGEPRTAVEIAVEPRGEEVEISVTNRGSGISASELPHVFDRFRRAARARASSTKGLGLGLYIVQGLVAAHGGHVSVDSIPGETTTFRFTVRTARGDDDVAYSRCG